MIVRLESTGRGYGGYKITPNKAMPWRQLIIVYIVIAGFSLVIAMLFFVQGYTLILPFSGIELLILGYAFHSSAWKGGAKEIITISEDSVTFESGRDAPERRSDFQRAWAKVVLERSWHPWYPGRLLIVSHGRQVEVGKFLNEQERQGLLKELKSVLA